MLYMSTIQVRTNDKTKKRAQKILKNLGLDLSTAVNMYLVRIVVEEGIPFPIRTQNGMTPEYERELLKEIAWAKKYGKSYSSAREMHEDIMREK